MAARKTATEKKAEKAAAAEQAAAGKQAAKDSAKAVAAAEKAEKADGEPHVFRTDRGEALPPQTPPPTATDKHA